MSERLHYPRRAARPRSRRAACADEDPVEGAELLAEAEEAWRALDRPLEATRARLLAGQLLLGDDDERARELLEQARRRESERSACRTWRRRRARAASASALHAAPGLLRAVRAGDHDHRRVPRQLLAGRVDRLALRDARACG